MIIGTFLLIGTDDSLLIFDFSNGLNLDIDPIKHFIECANNLLGINEYTVLCADDYQVFELDLKRLSITHKLMMTSYVWEIIEGDDNEYMCACYDGLFKVDKQLSKVIPIVAYQGKGIYSVAKITKNTYII